MGGSVVIADWPVCGSHPVGLSTVESRGALGNDSALAGSVFSCAVNGFIVSDNGGKPIADTEKTWDAKMEIRNMTAIYLDFMLGSVCKWL
jgi:hypothetical protein